MRRLAPSYGELITADSLRLAYQRWAGPTDALPLVLLHGLAQSGAAWSAVAPLLARRRAVIAWDARGHGASDWAGDAAYAGDAHFADVSGALDALGIERCILAGFSMGGGVAILCAGAAPERIARLIVVDAYPDPQMSPGSRAIAEGLAALAPRPTVARGDAPDRADPRPPFDPAIARAMAEQLAGDDPRRLDLWPFWEAGPQPALIVRGALSTVLTAEMAAEMVRRRPSARLLTLAGVGHAIPAERPVELASAIEQFSAEC